MVSENETEERESNQTTIMISKYNHRRIGAIKRRQKFDSNNRVITFLLNNQKK